MLVIILPNEWTETKNHVSGFNFLCGGRFKIAEVLDSRSAIPDWLNLYPNHSISVLAKVD